MALRFRFGTWIAYFDVGGHRREISLHTDNREIAEEFHKALLYTAMEERRALRFAKKHPEMWKRVLREDDQPTTEKPSFRHRRADSLRLTEMWELAISRRPLSYSHKIVWEKFVAGIGFRFADEVTPKAALDYLNANYSKRSEKTFNNIRTTLNTIFRCCLVEAHLTASPFAAIMPKRITQSNTHRNLTEEEFTALFHGTEGEKDLQIMIMLSRWTCQRLETCARMTPEMFNLKRMVFTIEPGKTRRFNKWVCVPIVPELEAYLAPLLPKCKPGVPIVQTFATAPRKNDYYSRQATAAFKRLGIADTEAGKASFHSLRGTAITWFKEHGIQGETLRSITGHASDDVEDIYARDIASLERVAKSLRSGASTGCSPV